MAQRIKKDDIVKIISGDDKGTTGNLLAVNSAHKTALVKEVGLGCLRVKPSQVNRHGGPKEIHLQVPLSKLARVCDESPDPVSLIVYTTNG